jgi:hypothetical protein
MMSKWQFDFLRDANDSVAWQTPLVQQAVGVAAQIASSSSTALSLYRTILL